MPTGTVHPNIAALQRHHDELAQRSEQLEADLVEIEKNAKKTSGRIQLPELSADVQTQDERKKSAD
jgi:hypothetical protein